MRKIIIGIIALVLLLVLFFTFNNSVGETPEAEEANREKTPEIIIGVNEPLSGKYADLGNSELLGIRFANQIIQTVTIGETTYDIKLLEEDNKSNTETSKVIAEKQRDSSCNVIIGSQIVEENGNNNLEVPIIELDGFASLSNIPSVYAMSLHNDIESRTIANFAYGMELDNCAVICINDSESSNLQATAYQKKFKKLGGKCTFYKISSSQNNFDVLVSKIKEENFDSIYLAADAEISPKVIKSIRKSGIRLPIFGVSDWDTYTFIKNCGFRGNNVYFPSDFSETDTENTINADFVTKFKSWVNSDTCRYELNGNTDTVSRGSSLGYNAYMLLVEALQQAPSANPSDITKVLNDKFSSTNEDDALDESQSEIKNYIYIKKLIPSKNSFEVLQTISTN